MRKYIYSDGLFYNIAKSREHSVFFSRSFVRGEGGGPPIRSPPPTLADADLPTMASTLLLEISVFYPIHCGVCVFLV